MDARPGRFCVAASRKIETSFLEKYAGTAVAFNNGAANY
jgi:hypothetical protein